MFWTLLGKAAAEGDREKVQELLRDGADVNARDYWGFTALYWAVENRHPEMVELLLQKGADKYVQCNKGLTALDRALYHHGTRPGGGRADAARLVRLLLGADYKLDELHRSFQRFAGLSCQQSPIWFAVVHGHHDLIPFFSKLGPSLDMDPVDTFSRPLLRGFVDGGMVDRVGHTPLTYAVACRDASLAECLVGADADPNGKNQRGETAEEMAKEKEYHDVLASLRAATGPHFVVNVEVSDGGEEGELCLTFRNLAGQEMVSFSWAAERDIGELPRTFLDRARSRAGPNSALHLLREIRLKFLHKDTRLDVRRGAAPFTAQVAPP